MRPPPSLRSHSHLSSARQSRVETNTIELGLTARAALLAALVLDVPRAVVALWRVLALASVFVEFPVLLLALLLLPVITLRVLALAGVLVELAVLRLAVLLLPVVTLGVLALARVLVELAVLLLALLLLPVFTLGRVLALASLVVELAVLLLALRSEERRVGKECS